MATRHTRWLPVCMLAASLAWGCSSDPSNPGGVSDARGGGSDTQPMPDAGQGDADKPDARTRSDSGLPDGGGDTGPGSQEGLRLKGALAPQGGLGISANYQLKGHLVPGPESGRTLEGATLKLTPVRLQKKSP